MPAGVKGKLFYGWVVVTASFFICAVAYGVRFSFGVFIKSIEGEFALSRAETSSVFSAHMALSAIFAVLGGWLIDRFGPKKVSLVMAVFMTLSLVTTSMTTSPWQLYITYSLLLAMGIGAGYAMVMATASRWFKRKRAFAMGIVGSGVGVGTIVMNPLSAYLILAFDWRTAFIVVGLVSGLIFISSSLLLKRDPREVGDSPDGLEAREAINTQDSHQGTPSAGFSLSQAFRTRSFWLLAVIYLFWSFSVHLVITHLVPHVMDARVSTAEAALMAGLVGAICIPGRLGGGLLADKLNKKATTIACALFQAVALLWLLWARESWGFYLFVIFFSLGYGGMDPPMLALTGEIFGLRSIGAIMGATVILWGIGAAIGPAVGGLVYDASGSYLTAFLVGAVLMLLAALCVIMVRREKVAAN